MANAEPKQQYEGAILQGGWQRFVNFTPISPYITDQEYLSAIRPSLDDLFSPANNIRQKSL